MEILFISKLPTRENSVSLPVVSSGVATLKSSEELSYNTLQLFLHLHCRNIFAVSCSEIILLERKGRCSCSVHLLTNRESLDLNSQGDIFHQLLKYKFKLHLVQDSTPTGADKI